MVATGCVAIGRRSVVDRNFMKPNRDDFPLKVKRNLAMRVGHVCSNPECEEHTSGPVATEDDYSNTGVAAHIRAAAVGGPRYDPEMTPEQRKSARNGIWLCSSCSVKVDDDVATYYPELLHQWKREAEQRAKRRQGQPLLTQTGVQRQLETIFSAAPSKSSQDALTNAVTAVGTFLRAMDPRFEVSVVQDGGTTRYQLTAKEPVVLGFHFEPVNLDGARQELVRLHEHGGEGRIEVSRFSIDGSPLVARLVGQGSGHVELAAQERPASVRLWLSHTDGQQTDLFVLEGRVTGGTKSHTVSAAAFDGTFGLELQLLHPTGPDAACGGEVLFSFEPEAWRGRNIKRLPAIEPLRSLFGGLLDGARLMAEAFVEEAAIWSTDITPTDMVFVGGQQALLDYAHFARTLADKLSLSLAFLPDHSFDFEELNLLAQVAQIAQGKYAGRVTSDIEVVIEWDPHVIDKKQLTGTEVALRFEERDGKLVRIYGQEVAVPPVAVDVNVVFPEIEMGGSQRVSLQPAPDAIAKYEFIRSHRI
jgi:hypothetical protein